MVKLQGDREFLEALMTDALTEVSREGTFTQLSDTLRHCHEDKRHKEQTILRYLHVLMVGIT